MNIIRLSMLSILIAILTILSSPSPLQSRDTNPFLARTIPPPDEGSPFKDIKDRRHKRIDYLSSNDANLFEEGLDFHRRELFEYATQRFLTLLDRFPNSRYAERAAFLVGDCYYQMAKRSRYKRVERVSKGYFHKAKNAYSYALHTYPESSLGGEAIYHLGDIHLNLGLYYESMSHFLEFIQKYPDSPNLPKVFIGRAKSYLMLRRIDDAKRDFYFILSNYKDEDVQSSAFFGLGDALYLEGDARDALRQYEEGIKEWPYFLRDNPETKFKYAETLLLNQQYEKSLQKLFDLQIKYRGRRFSDQVQARIGDVLFKSGEVSHAITAYSNAISRYPDSIGSIIAKLRLSDIAAFIENELNPCLMDLKKEGVNLVKKEEVIRILNDKGGVNEEVPLYLEGMTYDHYKPLIKDSGLVVMLTLEGGTIKKRIHPQEVYNEITKRYPLHPLSELALWKWGIYLKKKGEYFKSLHTLQEMVARFPFGPLVKQGRKDMRDIFKEGMGYFFDKKDYIMVLKMHDEFLDSVYLEKAYDMDVMLLIGEAFFKLELYPRARVAIRDVLESDALDIKDEERADFLLARSYLMEGNLERSEGIFKDMIVKFPRGDFLTDVLYSLADNLYLQGKYKEAIGYYSRALDTDPQSPYADFAHYYMGNAYRNIKKYEEAAGAFQKVVEGFALKEKEEIPFYVPESYFQKGDCLYTAGKMKQALEAYTLALNTFPEDRRANWALYRISTLEEMIGSKDKSETTLKSLQKGKGPFWRDLGKGLEGLKGVKEEIEDYFKE